MRPSFQLLLLLLLTLSGCGSTPSQVAHSGGDEGSGIGGTGITVVESGIGGTGRVLAESGIGGTGMPIAESGIGGTGIIGEITGFGSIFVNGIEVELTEQTRVEYRGENYPVETLERGDVVELLAVKGEVLPEAQRVALRREVVGEVTAVDGDNRRFTVLGQTVSVDDSQTLPKPGSRIEVSGLRDVSGVIQATRWQEARGSSGVDAVIGQVRRSEGPLVVVGDLSIQLPEEGAVKVGQTLRVNGHLRQGVLHAGTIEHGDFPAFMARSRHLLVQTVVQHGRIANYPLKGATLPKHGDIPLPVRVEMQRGDDGRLQLRGITEFHRLPRGASRPAALNGHRPRPKEHREMRPLEHTRRPLPPPPLRPLPPPP